MTSQQEFILHKKRYKRKVTFYRIFFFVLFIVLWEVTARLDIINAFIFSSPSRIWSSFAKMVTSGELFYHIGITLTETLVSFALIVIVGIIFAVLLWLFTTFSDVCEPYLIVLNSLPKSALAPLMIVWLGNNTKTIIVTAISVAIFGTIINIYTSFREVDPEKIKLIYTLGGNKLNVLFKLIIPNSMPVIISTMKVNIGLCLVGVVIGEFLAAKAGLGYLIIYGSQTFKMDWVLMSIVILCIIAMVLYKSINFIEKKYNKNISQK